MGDGPMKKFILGAAIFPLFSVAAYAADLPNTKGPAVFAHPQPVFWTGCYIDGGGGYGMYNTNSYAETSPPTVPPLVPVGPTVTNGGRGGVGRLGGGCDYQFSAGSLGNFVAGAFADYDFTGLGGTFSDPAGPVQGSETERGAWHAGARLGYLVTPSLLAYIDGGYTQTSFDAVNFFTADVPPRFTGLALSGNTYGGWFIGGGTEFALNMPWIPIRGLFWRTEYRFAQYQSADVPIVIAVPPGGPFGISEHISPYVQTITTSLVWRFNFGGPPIATRY